MGSTENLTIYSRSALYPWKPRSAREDSSTKRAFDTSIKTQQCKSDFLFQFEKILTDLLGFYDNDRGLKTPKTKWRSTRASLISWKNFMRSYDVEMFCPVTEELDRRFIELFK